MSCCHIGPLRSALSRLSDTGTGGGGENVGELVKVPAAAWTWTTYAPGVFSGASVSPPVAAWEWTAYSPTISISALVEVPAAAWTWTAYAPIIATGASVLVPAEGWIFTAYAPVIRTPGLLYEAITDLGLLTSLELCLDSRDAVSFTSGQSWLDRSGNGYDFFLGADGSATATDPTFTGTAGTYGAYFLFDGGDYFTYDSANETWMNNLHKDNAAWTIAGYLYYPGGAAGIVSTRSGAGVNGIQIVTTGGFGMTIFNAAGTGLATGALTAIPTGVWSFFAMSFDEAGGATASIAAINGTQVTFNGAITSPSASNASATMVLGTVTTNELANGSRMAGVMAWSRALSSAELTSLFNATKGPFGL